jgi:hypothetical protein
MQSRRADDRTRGLENASELFLALQEPDDLNRRVTHLRPRPRVHLVEDIESINELGLDLLGDSPNRLEVAEQSVVRLHPLRHPEVVLDV